MGDIIVKNKQVILLSYPNEGPITQHHLNVMETQLDIKGCKQGEVTVKNMWISVDPYLRGLMTDLGVGSFLQSLKLGQPIVSKSVSKVVASADEQFKEGDIVLGYSDVAEYAVFSRSGLTKLNPDVAPLPHYLGLLGSSGLTAYIGLMKIGEPKPGEQVFVSATAGAVGLVIGQLAKLNGCGVVGATSSDEKVGHIQFEPYNGFVMKLKCQEWGVGNYNDLVCF